MTDYYLGFTVKSPGFMRPGISKWNSRLNGLAIGESFTVGTESCRKGALRAAARIGVTMSSRKIAGGFEMKRINTCQPRKRGHPKRII